MKLTATNQKSLMALDLKILNSVTRKLVERENAIETFDLEKNGAVKMQFFLQNFRQDRVIKISKQVYENAMLVSVDHLSDLIELDTKHRDIVILYSFDKLAYVRKLGKEISFLIVDFVNLEDGQSFTINFGNYNFISGSFYPDDKIEDKKELLKILIYLFHGEVTQKFVDPKGKWRKSSISTILNNSKYGIYFADSTWKVRVNVSGFKVRGHFRLQPHGFDLLQRKLIFIEEFAKKGYRRRAIREVYEEIVLPKQE